jgi:Tfp pilus assembly protein PilF
MRLGLFFVAVTAAFPQTPPEAAYKALETKQYDEAISWFLKAIDGPGDTKLWRKDLAYTYLKTGERELARDQFGEVARLDPGDGQAGLEYAFLCFETRKEAEARRTFDRLRRSADAAVRTTAETAFQNIDRPLAAAIERWTEAVRRGDNSFSTNYELARLAERRDELALAAEQYQKAWRIAPEQKSVLIDLGRVWKALGRRDDSTAALLAASRGGEARAAEDARELLPAHYPYVYEFENALQLDPRNIELRREFAYLLLRMKQEKKAEEQFRQITTQDPGDLLSAAQLGFLLLAHRDAEAARPLLDRVLQGNDKELANRARAVLRLPQVADPGAPSAKQMAERSIKAGYLKDARRYLDAAHEADPLDFAVILKLGWVCNLLHDDEQAFRWFELARKSPDAEISTEAERSWRNLRSDMQTVRFSAWAFPSYSSRWHDTFSYGQVKAEWNLHLPVRPYLSARIIADTRSEADPINPMYYSESAVIAGAGLTTNVWHGARLWGEAGSAIGYLSGHVTPDYRGGLSFARSHGKRWFFDTTADAVFLSRFEHDGIAYWQNRAGYSLRLAGWEFQPHLCANATADVKRQYWANFVETGPGIRIRSKLPEVPIFTIAFVRGAYTINESNPRRPNYWDLRIGLWYALSR